MSLAKKLVDDDLDSSSGNEEQGTTSEDCIQVSMPMNVVIPRRRLVDDDLDSSASSESESEAEIGNDIGPGSSSSVKISELKGCNLSETDKDGYQADDNDSTFSTSKSISLKTTEGDNSRLSSTDSDEDCAGPSCNFDDSDLDEVGDKKYRPKQSKQSKTKKKSKKKTQKTGTGSNKNNDKNSNQHSDNGEIEIKTAVPLSTTGSNSGRKNNQTRRANQKPRQYRRERTERPVSTQKPPKIPNIPHPHGHVEVKRVTANDAIDILERMKARLAIDSDQETDNKKTGSGAKGIRVGGKGGKEICSVLVIRKKPEFCSDNDE